MAGFILIGFALFSGDLLPWSIRSAYARRRGCVTGCAFRAAPYNSNRPWRELSVSPQDDVLDGEDS